MKTSVRTANTSGSNVNLISELMRFSGDRLILSAGYLTWFQAMPFNEIQMSVGQIDLVVGDWQQKTPQQTQAWKQQLQQTIANFAARVAQESDEYGVQKPDINVYVVPNWHAKVAMMVDTGRHTASAAVIGSSNISAPALGMFMQGSNIEADVLICCDDGPDAGVELKLLFTHLESAFTGYFFAKY